jgi:hypothetical protein
VNGRRGVDVKARSQQRAVERAKDRDLRQEVQPALEDRKLLCVGTHISPTLIYQTLADLGAKDRMLLDGGDSSSMAIGTGAKVVSPGPVYGWRPVANQFGVRAEPLH